MINEKRVPCLHKFRKQCLEPSSIGFFASGLLRGFSKLRCLWVSERITVCSLWPKRCFDHGTLLYSGVYGKSGFSQHIFSDTGFLERSQESRVLVAGCCRLTLWSQAGQVTSLGLSSLIQKNVFVWSRWGKKVMKRREEAGPHQLEDPFQKDQFIIWKVTKLPSVQAGSWLCVLAHGFQWPLNTQRPWVWLWRSLRHPKDHSCFPSVLLTDFPFYGPLALERIAQ